MRPALAVRYPLKLITRLVNVLRVAGLLDISQKLREMASPLLPLRVNDGS